MSRKRYRLLGRLETGELAELYKGMRDDHEAVVVKLFLARTSALEYARDLAETSRALSGLRGIGILHELEIGLYKGRLAVVREALDGFNLGTALQRLSTKEVLLHPGLALQIIIRLLETVGQAHDAGVIHGAITPGNVILSRTGQMGICDFGVIRALEAAPALKAFLSRGRSAYRAVELEQGEPATIQSDIYSLGAIAYELVTLKEALVGKGANVSTRRDAMPPPPSRLDRRINGRLDPLIMRAIDQVASRRYKSCQEFAQGLRHFVSQNGGLAGAGEMERFVDELYPNEVTLTLGPVPFSEQFSLNEVSGADLHPEVTGDVALRSSFSGGAAPDLEDSATDQGNPAFPSFDPGPQPSAEAMRGVGRHDRQTIAAPPIEEPNFDDGTEPGNAGPLEVGWHAPSAASSPAKLARSGPKAQIAGASQPAFRTRVKLVEDFHPLGDAPPPDTDRHRPAMPIQEVSAPAAMLETSGSLSSSGMEALGSSAGRRLSTAGLRVLQLGTRRRTMGLLAAIVACVGVATFAYGLRRYGRSRPAPPPPVVVVPPAPPRITPVVQPPPPAPPELPPTHLDPTPPTADPAHGQAFVTLLCNVPANIYVDGVRQHVKAPVKKLPVQPGTRKIVLESIRTGERREFQLVLQKGDQKKVVEDKFATPPGTH